MKYAFVFPGQGSQFVGMGKELADNFRSAKDVFDEVDHALGQSLYKIMTEGTDAELTLTTNTQPALMAVSMAVVKVLEKEFHINLKEKTTFVAGHSLGEYTAACAAGVFSLTDTARLLRIRGDAMQKAVPAGVGGMAAVLGLSFKDVDALVDACNDESHFCVAANDNSNGQVVLSGHIQAIEKAIEIASEFGAKRCVRLPVSAPFHSPLMQPAAEAMAHAFMEVEAHDAVMPIVANVTAQPETDKKEIIKNLITQVTGTVRWRETMDFFHNSKVTDIVELGAGKVLSGIAKRSLADVNSISVYSVQDIEDLAKNL